MHALGGRLAGHPRRTYLVSLWRWVGSGCPWPDQGACARGATLVVMDLSPFRIERFYDRYEHSTRFMLSGAGQSRVLGARAFWFLTRKAGVPGQPETG